MQPQNTRLLIVEDTLAEQDFAKQAALSHGFNDIILAQTLEDALHYIPQVQAVATDLFFPNGNVNVDKYVQRLLPLYVAHAQKQGKLPTGHQTILRAIEKTSEVLGMTPAQYVENIATRIGETVVNSARASLPGYAQTFDIKYFLKNEPNLPVGILVTEEAMKYGLPSVIVTSGGGHDGLLQPIRSLVKVPYETYLKDGHKDWDSGLAKLLGRGK